MTVYPIDALLPELCAQLQPGSTILLQAPPGAGKTTRVPLALIGALGPMGPPDPIQGRLWMVEPRRLAARAAATRLADTLDEPVGDRIGYAIRGERRTSANTQVEVMTDGLFLRRLQADPSLEGVGGVLFDEFHERKRDADLSLALLREARPLLRPELPLMLMSATLDISDLIQRLPDATVLTSEGRSFPVETHHQVPRPDEPLARQVLRAVESHRHLLPAASSVLVFLPGLTEIRRCRELLEQSHSLQDWDIQILHGQLPLEEQSRALQRCNQARPGKLILSSAVAESSVTLNGVRLVIDSGLSRQLRYDPNSGMEGLETVLSSVASSDQRRGRAGRLGPGHCVRLWSPANQQRRPSHSPPELRLADPQPVVLELAAWGAGLGETLPWLEPPPASALMAGRQQLLTLKALSPDGRLSTTGRLLSRLGVHPRLGLLMLDAQRRGAPELGCDLAALLSERDPLSRQDSGCDLGARLSALHQQKRLAPIRQRSRQLQQQLQRLDPGRSDPPGSEPASAAELLLTAFPEWLALQRPGQPNRFQLRQGRGALLPDHDPLLGCEALAVARVDMGGRNTQIQLALPLQRIVVEHLAEVDGHWQETLSWDEAAGRIRSERILHLGELCIRREPLASPKAEECRDLMLKLLRDAGHLELLPWTDTTVQLQRRLTLIHRELGPPWPQRDMNHLFETAPHWLGPALEGCQRWQDLEAATLQEALWGEMDWNNRQQLDRLLPTIIPIPSGRSARLRYDTDDQIVLAVKLQEMFGCAKTPRLLQGRLPVTVELLSPAGRPLQRTQDLEGFWHGSYTDVRREMRGRYPKHPWPEQPWSAEATTLTKKRLQENNSG